MKKESYSKSLIRNPSRLFRIFKEYRYTQLTKLRNTDLPVIERMKKDWDERAQADAKFFVNSVYRQSDEKFWENGRYDCNIILGSNTKRHNLIFDGKNPDEMKVLEIGCGIGRILFPMSQIFGEAVGVDVSPTMIKIGQEYANENPHCKFFINNGYSVPQFTNNYFDFCYSFLVFQHIPEKEIVINYIKEVSRVLKNGGLFRFQVHGNSDDNLVDKSTWNGVHFSQEEMYKIAIENNFEVLEEDGQNDQCYWLTFKSVKDL